MYKHLKDTIRSFNKMIETVVFSLGITIVAIIVTALTLSAVTRYISGIGYDWFIELPPALVSWLVFPLLGPLLKTGSHIEVDFVSTVMTKRTLRFVKLFVYFISLLSSFIFFKAGLDATMLFYNLGQMMELEIDVPIWIMFLSFPVGFVIMGLFSLELLLTTIQEINESSIN